MAAPIEYVHRPEAADGPHGDVIVLDHQVAPLDQRHAHLARQEDVLEIGRVVDARREQGDLRFRDRVGCEFGERGPQPPAVIVDRHDVGLVDDVGQYAQHHVPVLDHVGDAGRGPDIVLEHHEAAVLVAHDVGAGDVGVDAARHVEADHRRLEVWVADHQRARHHAVPQDRLVVIDVPKEPVDRLHALAHAAFHQLPFARGQDARDEIERQHAIDRVALRVHRERDAEIVKFGLGEGGAAAEFDDVERGEPARQRGDGRIGQIGRREIFAEEAAAVVAVEQAGLARRAGRDHAP